MMNRAVEIDRDCLEHCRNFQIMESPLWPDALLLRWTTINIDNIDNPVQCYRYECFDQEGNPQHCSVYYADQEEANLFFQSLMPLHWQLFASDHHRRNYHNQTRQ